MTDKDNDAFDEAKRPHRKRQAGPKREKKKSKSDAENNVVKPKNPKAYSFHSLRKTERAVRRAADLGERKLHRPVVHRQTELPPPVLVAVVGPPQVGKTTLIRCLIKNFTGKNVLTIQGPITVISSKKLRITFIECNNDLNSMIDLSKSVDLVLLVNNAKRSFEMEVFEFVSLVEAHGKMRTMGILTHIDEVKNTKLIQKREKFWKKSLPKAKLFKLSKIIDNEYQRKEIENLGRFIEVMKYEPIEWRTTHPYVLVDRVEDMTDPEELKKNDKLDRTVCMYGYARGTNFDKNAGVHVLGVGDFTIDEMNHMPDPCPFPWELKKRSLNKQERLVYAPFSGVGGVLMDKDAVYLETATIQSLNNKRRLTEKDKLLQTFNNVESDGDEEKDQAVFDDGDDDDEDEEMYDKEEGDDDDDDEEEGDDDEEEDDNNMSQEVDESMEVDDEDDDEEEGDSGDDFMGDHLSDDDEEEEDDEGDDDDEKVDKKAKMQVENMRKGLHTFLERQKKDGNIQRLIYDYDPMAEEKEEIENEASLVDGLFRVAKATRKGKLANQVETSVQRINADDYKQDDISKLLESLSDRIRIKGKDDRSDDDGDDADSDDGGDVDFGDEDGFGDDDDDEDDEEEDEEKDDEEEKKDPMQDEYEEPETAKERRTRRREEKMQERKRRQKELFDSMYDDENPGKKNHFETLKDEMAQQAQINMSEFGQLNEEARTQFEGFRPGLYVRIQIKNFPSEFMKNFDPSYPLIIGGLLNQERNVGYITVSLNKHRWYKGMMKTDDPLTLSLGWRRFQTIPIYSRRDDNGRNRRVKAIQGIGFQATFWGPLTPQATGIAAVGMRMADKKEFRLAASGVVREVDQAPTIQKKLKLCGEPILVHKNTAFVEKMFNTDLEVAKFQSAQIKTVSGIRGQIKKSVQNGSTLMKKLNIKRDIQPGCFRATFEDKIKLSDIVFLTAWVKAPVEQFYNPISNLLLPTEQRGEWKGMRSAWEVRKDRGIQRNPDEKSLYKDIVRPTIRQSDLKIPRDLMRELPFEFKPKSDAKVVDNVKRVAVIKDVKERKVDQMMKQLRAIYDQKRKDKRVEMRSRAATHKKQMEAREKKKGLQRKSKK